MRILVGLLWALIGAGHSYAQLNDVKLAARCFQEAKWASDDDGGSLWGKELYGPMLLANPETRQVMANQPDTQGKLHKVDGEAVWTGELEKSVGISNTDITWSGTHWTMVMWPLPDSPANRAKLMMHECWHRIQSSIGLPSGRNGANEHLDTRDGRIWIRLEWRALSEALISWGPERKMAIADALTFRAYRRTLFPNAASAEDRMEMHEGLAEYTGVRLMGLSDWGRRSYVSGQIKVDATRPSYPFSFAYSTGPAYGLLLDMEVKPWRAGLKTTASLSELLRSDEELTLPADLEQAAMDRANAYNGLEVFVEELKRDEAHQRAVTQYTKALIDGPTLELPIPNGNFTFDPTETVSMGDKGQVFPTSHIADDWGVLEVTGGVLLSPNYKVATVSAPSASNQLKTTSWTLNLNPGWKLVQTEKPGSYRVAKG